MFRRILISRFAVHRPRRVRPGAGFFDDRSLPVRHEPKNGRGHDGLEDEIKDHVPLLGGQMFFIESEEQGA